jgi:ferredoxin/flavodoxin---NADP+ reductase
MKEKGLNAVVLHKSEVAPGLMIVRVAPEGWGLPDFTPGQFAVLGLPGSAPRVMGADPEDPAPDPDRLISRAYSVASSSKSREYLEFYVTLVRSGALTPRLFRLEIGDRLWLGAKITGRFTLDDVPLEANVVLLATGTGIAPYMSMIRTVLTQQSRRRVAVVHGARHSWDLGYSAELITLERVCPALAYIPVINCPQEEPVPWAGRVGFVQDVWSGGALDQAWGSHPSPADTHVLLCGNPMMIEAMERILRQEGFAEHTPRSPGQYHLERFW